MRTANQLTFTTCEASLKLKTNNLKIISLCSQSKYGRTFYLNPERDYWLIGPIPRGTTLWQRHYDKRTSIEKAYSEEKGSYKLADLRVRELSKVKIHVYLALCAQIIKCIGAAITERLIRPETESYQIKA